MQFFLFWTSLWWRAQYDLQTYTNISRDVDELIFKTEPDTAILDAASTWRRVTEAGGAMRAAQYFARRERQGRKVRTVCLDGTMYKEGLIDASRSIKPPC